LKTSRGTGLRLAVAVASSCARAGAHKEYATTTSAATAWNRR
jgi:hypothetical protein